MTKAVPFNPYAMYEVNEDLETAGVWLVDPFSRMRVARAGGKNTKFQSLYEALTKPFRRAIETKTLPKEQDMALSRELYAKACVVNWSVAEVEMVKGKPVAKKDEHGEVIWQDGMMHDPETFEVVPMSWQMVVKTFELKPELYTYIVQRANDVTVYRDEDGDEIDVKN